MLQALPIGIQTFSEIREGGFVYIDKTGHARRLIEQGKYFLLTRPRRFGKSLFLDTLKEIFECNEALFRGLAIHARWNWTQPYPVIKISFGGGVIASRADLNRRIKDILRINQERLGLICEDTDDMAVRFAELIRKANAITGQRVVVLVDEYDKPILDNIDNLPAAIAVREGLKDLYSVIKESDAHIRFAFLTGVSKFSKVSLFSGLNNVEDISLDAGYATICGYTHADVENSLAAHLAGVDMEEARRWYNGYNWLGEPVYNPFDILLFISKGHLYRSYWFETGSPSFLIRLFQKNSYFLPEVETIEVTDAMLDSFDIEHIEPAALLFQTGYLTIDRMDSRFDGVVFRLKFPNHEVRTALNRSLLQAYTSLSTQSRPMQNLLYDSLLAADLDGMRQAIFRLFAAIPYRNLQAGHLPDYEGYYASVLYAFFASLGMIIIPEDVASHGQVDLTVKAPGHIFVVEMKVVKGGSVAGNPALEQIISRGYAAKYRGLPETTVHEIGMVFSRESRNLLAFEARSDGWSEG